MEKEVVESRLMDDEDKGSQEIEDTLKEELRAAEEERRAEEQESKKKQEESKKPKGKVPVKPATGKQAAKAGAKRK